ncbi:Mitogen-activated protein kinase kinase kinase 7 [Homalodisca vitripennis]|nr:Mitogen-activated protein kinase kinase kinase 7 [Homalodisca vitripennis]
MRKSLLSSHWSKLPVWDRYPVTMKSVYVGALWRSIMYKSYCFNATAANRIAHFRLPTIILSSRECWDKNPSIRPSMEEVVRIMTALFTFVSGYDVPLQFEDNFLGEGEGEEEEEYCETENTLESQSNLIDSYIENLSTYKVVLL